MKRAIFLCSLAGAAALGTVRIAARLRPPPRTAAAAGRCADARRKLRWSGYCAADFS